MYQEMCAASSVVVLSSRRVLVLGAAAQTGKLLLALALDHLLPDYDTSADLNAHICTQNVPSSGFLQPAWKLIVWDSVFFMRIACQGYEYEQQYAFFPLLGALLRPALSHPSVLAAAGLLITWIAFSAAALLMAHLSLAVTHHPQTAALATLVFIFNPASIFLTAFYTEALFSFLTLLGLCILYIPVHQGASHRTATRPTTAQSSTLGSVCRMWGAAVCFMLASATRSNGIVNAGYILHAGMQAAITAVSSTPRGRRWQPQLYTTMRVVVLLSAALCGAVLTGTPLLLHQLHAHASFCNQHHHANPALQPTRVGHILRSVINTWWAPALESLQAGRAPATAEQAQRVWCAKQPAWWPAVYGFVQKEYWDVGLFRYWRLSQVPNFLLAMPVLVIAFGCVGVYVRRRPRHMLLGAFTWSSATSGHEAITEPQNHSAVVQAESSVRRRSPRLAKAAQDVARAQVPARASPGQSKTTRQLSSTLQVTSSSDTEAGFFSPEVGVFMYPLAFLAACAAVVMHVQVATRFLASCPPLYWFAAQLCMSSKVPGGPHINSMHHDRAQKQTVYIFWMWCWSYLMLGSVLFSNFYPWT